MHLTSEQVRSKDFGTTRSGYNPADVRAFLVETADTMVSFDTATDGLAKEAAGTKLMNAMLNTVFGQARKGFKPSEVDDFIDALAEEIHEQTGLPGTLAAGMDARLQASRPAPTSWWRRLIGG